VPIPKGQKKKSPPLLQELALCFKQFGDESANELAQELVLRLIQEVSTGEQVDPDRVVHHCLNLALHWQSDDGEQRGEKTRVLKVFLCHANEDKAQVRELHSFLKRQGFHPWLDEIDILPGQNWKLEINRAVRSSDVVIVCLSVHTGRAGFFQKEIREALDVADQQPEGTIFVIPLRLDGCEVPERLKGVWQWVDLFTAGGHARLPDALRARASSLQYGGECHGVVGGTIENRHRYMQRRRFLAWVVFVVSAVSLALWFVGTRIHKTVPTTAVSVALHEVNRSERSELHAPVEISGNTETVMLECEFWYRAEATKEVDAQIQSFEGQRIWAGRIDTVSAAVGQKRFELHVPASALPTGDYLVTVTAPPLAKDSGEVLASYPFRVIHRH